MSLISLTSTPQVGPDYTQELLEAAGVSRFPWRNEEVLLKHYIGNDPDAFLVEIVVFCFFRVRLSLKIVPKGLAYFQVKPFIVCTETLLQYMHMLEKTILKSSAQACKHLDVLGR